jgi:glutamate N-acetyltransferase/amino-acid N-acetyltransferase
MKDRANGSYLSADPVSGDSVAIRLRVGAGAGSGLAWGCDLSDQYVRINADYTT